MNKEAPVQYHRHRGMGKLACLTALLLVLSGCASRQGGDEAYQPTVGQHGKDVMWVPTPEDLVVRMLETAKVTADDLVYDLGAGDGKIPIQAARQFGARAVGIEYDPKLVALAQRNVLRAGVSDRVNIIQGDIFKEDFSKATVVTLYLLTELNLRLKPTLLNMKPGTRVVSHSFGMGTWAPDEVIGGEQNYYGFFWIVPAKIQGRWLISTTPDQKPLQIDFTQRFQNVAGQITRDKEIFLIENGRLKGSSLHFTYTDSRQLTYTVTAEIDGAQLSGRQATASAAPQVLSGRKIQ